MKVAIVGASGETGQSIINGLLETPDKFTVTALVRPESTSKPEIQQIKERGVAIVPLDLEASSLAQLTEALVGQEVLISCVIPTASDLQNRLADAAKAAGVERFVPSSFAPACPPTGVMILRDIKEETLNHVKRLYLPYTIIDVGWWYQISYPRLPSGKIDHAVRFPMNDTYGTGKLPNCLTDLRDVGKYVARIIADPRTINKAVFVYNEIHTQEDIFAMIEKASGEAIPRNHLSKEQVGGAIAAARKAYEENKSDVTLLGLGATQYADSIWLRGDNLPASAEYLGYLNGKELYPDVKYTTYAEYVDEIVAGKGRAVYANRVFAFESKDGKGN